MFHFLIPKKERLLWFFMCLLVFQGCHSAGDLELESVASYKAKKKAAGQATPSQTDRTSSAETALEDDKKILAQSKEIPPEIALFELPPSFRRLSDIYLLPAETKSVVDGLLPNASAVWGSPQWGIVAMAAEAPMDPERIKVQTREEFFQELRIVGNMSEQYYKFRKEARTNYEIQSRGNVVVLKFSANFGSQEAALTHLRYFFYYRPDRRLDFFVSGKSEDVALLKKDIDVKAEAFEEKLSRLYPDGMPFRKK